MAFSYCNVYCASVRIFFLFLIAFDCARVCVTQYDGTTCRLEDGASGVCRSRSSCPAAIRGGRDLHYPQFRRCGFEGIEEVICCPPESYNTRSNENIPTTGKDDYDGKETERRTSTTTEDNIVFWDEPNLISKTQNSIRKADQACKEFTNDVSAALTPYILGGEDAGLGEFPHMVALGYMLDTGLEFNCGGTLISNRYVLTAAHCVVNLEGAEPSVARMGTVSLTDETDKSQTDFGVEESIVHPDYKRSLKYNDIALLRLNKTVPFSANLHPACLYTSHADPQITMTVTGWGSVSVVRNSKSDTLLKANLTAVDVRECNQTYNSLRAMKRKLPNGIQDHQICAVDRGAKMDTCSGDSGGPLQVGHGKVDGLYDIVAVTSFGQGCGAAIPAVYTRVSRFLDWIENAVWP